MSCSRTRYRRGGRGLGLNSRCPVRTFFVGPASWGGLRYRDEFDRHHCCFTCKQPEIRYLRPASLFQAKKVYVICSLQNGVYRFHKVDKIRLNMTCSISTQHCFLVITSTPFTAYKLQFKLQGLFQSLPPKAKLPARHICSSSCGGWGGRRKKIHPAANSVPLTGLKIEGLRTGIRFFQLKFSRQISGAESPPSGICDGRA